MRQAVALLLRQHEPFLATALDRRSNIVMCNGPYSRFLEMLGDEKLRLTPYRVLPAPRLNLLKLLFGPFRPIVANWDEAAREVLERAQREAASDRDATRRQIVEECVRRAAFVARAAKRSSAAPGGRRGPPPRRAPAELLQHHHHAGDGAGHHAAGIAHRVVPSGRRAHGAGRARVGGSASRE